MVKPGLLDDYGVIIGEVPNVVISVTSQSKPQSESFTSMLAIWMWMLEQT